MLKRLLKVLTKFWTRLYYKMCEEALREEVTWLKRIICNYISELRREDRDQDKIRITVRELTRVYEEENGQQDRIQEPKNCSSR